MRRRSCGLTEAVAEKDAVGRGASVSTTSRSAASLEIKIGGRSGRQGLLGRRICDRRHFIAAARRHAVRLRASRTVSQGLATKRRRHCPHCDPMLRGRGQSPMRCPIFSCGENGRGGHCGRLAPSQGDGLLVSLCPSGRLLALKVIGAKLAPSGASTCRVLMLEMTLPVGTSRGTSEVSEMRSY